MFYTLLLAVSWLSWVFWKLFTQVLNFFTVFFMKSDFERSLIKAVALKMLGLSRNLDQHSPTGISFLNSLGSQRFTVSGQIYKTPC